MKLVIDRKKVKSQDISFFKNEAGLDWPLRDGEHYRLLTYISNQINRENIIDAGTYQGLSCLSLAQNKNNNIFSYDIVALDIKFLNSYNNVTLKIQDINNESEEFIKSAKIILLDIDPHDGIQEAVFSKRMKDIGYEGFVICDDIYLNPAMKSWWENIDETKYDLTEVGHMHGTGIVCYGNVKIKLI